MSRPQTVKQTLSLSASARNTVWRWIVPWIRRTFSASRWARRDDGGQMPAYSRFIGDYGAGREWYPTRFHNVAQGIDAGSVSLGIDVGMNVAREFMPRWLIH